LRGPAAARALMAGLLWRIRVTPQSREVLPRAHHRRALRVLDLHQCLDRPDWRGRYVRGGSDSRSSRFNNLRTDSGRQNRCPLAVGMPHAVSAAAMACGEIIPFARISAITGASAIARASAFAATNRRAASRASGVATVLKAIALRSERMPRPERGDDEAPAQTLGESLARASLHLLKDTKQRASYLCSRRKLGRP
jgi:hypothetical protein